MRSMLTATSGILTTIFHFSLCLLLPSIKGPDMGDVQRESITSLEHNESKKHEVMIEKAVFLK